MMNAPYVAIGFGDASCELYFMCERMPLVRSTDFLSLLISLITAYYSFDIAYLPSLKNVLIFSQHFILEIKDSQQFQTLFYSFVVLWIRCEGNCCTFCVFVHAFFLSL